ncbi:MAG: hypothetical protein Q8R28_03500 [Dehalococcoidia bacterium]|nr:hypothetical protein [Dehalococcoidia bacterium]
MILAPDPSCLLSWQLHAGSLALGTAAPLGAGAAPSAPGGVVAAFNSRTGRFESGSGASGWAPREVPQDRSARQLGYYMDLGQLEVSGKQQGRGKRAQPPQGADWREYKQVKKKEKWAKNNKWLFED